MIQGIYKITNKINNKIYIGSSNNVVYRWEQHIFDLKNEKHHNVDLQRDYILLDKNINNFSFEIIKMFSGELTKEELFQEEGKCIYKFSSYKMEIGYNKIINNFKGYVNIKKETKKKEKDNNIIQDDSYENLINYVDIIDKNILNKMIENIELQSISLIKNFKYDFINEEGFLSKYWMRKNKESLNLIRKMATNYFRNYCETKDKKIWTTYIQYKSYIKDKGFTKGFVLLNNCEDKKKVDCCAFFANIYMNTIIKNVANTKSNEDKYALSFILKWIINNIDLNRKVKFFIPSQRMFNILNNYLLSQKDIRDGNK